MPPKKPAGQSSRTGKMSPHSKACNDCGNTKPQQEFIQHKNGKCGNTCEDCARKLALQLAMEYTDPGFPPTMGLEYRCFGDCGETITLGNFFREGTVHMTCNMCAAQKAARMNVGMGLEEEEGQGV